MSDIMPGQPGDTNPTAHDVTVAILAATGLRLENAELLARRIGDVHRAETLSEVADTLMAVDETAAALLVDRLRGGGQR